METPVKLGTLTAENSPLIVLVNAAMDAYYCADPELRPALYAERNRLLVEAVETTGASVRELALACGLYESTVVLVLHPERFPEMMARKVELRLVP
jgi:hypothetical protein